MSDQSILPPHLVLLDKALRPIALKAQTRIAKAPFQTERVANMIDFIRHHLATIEDDVVRLEEEVNGELSSIAEASKATEAEVHRAAARLEVQLERLLNHYNEVRRVRPDHGYADGWRFLTGVYRDLLMQVQRWLGELIDFLEDPVAALKKRQLPTSGDVEFTLALKIVPSPSLRELTNWASRKATEMEVVEKERFENQVEEAAARSARAEERSLFALILAAFGLGWLVGGGDE